MKLKNLFAVCIAVVVFTIVLAVFYPDRMFSNQLNWGESTLHKEIPQATLFVKTIKAGSFPLWNPYKACGMPFFETTNLSIYHPLVILYFLLPVERAINYIALAHIVMSAFFMCLLCLTFRLSLPASFFCAVSWICASPFQYYLRAGYLPKVISASFFPVLVYLFIKVMHTNYSRRTLFFVASTFATALSITGGYPTMTAIVVYSIFVFLLFSLRNPESARTLLYIFLSALLLSIVYWGPVFIQPPGLIFSPGKNIHYALSDLKNFLFPFTLIKGYIGRLGLVLGLIGLFLRTPFSKHFRLLSLFSLLLMFTYDLGSWSITPTDFFPIANKTYKAFEWHLGLIFSLIIAAGFCLDRVLWLSKKKPVFTVIGLCVVGLCIVFQLADLYRFNRRFYPEKFKLSLREYFPTTPFVDFFQKDHSLFRVSNELYDFGRLRKNQGMLDGFNMLQSTSRGVLLDKLTGQFDLKQKVAWETAVPQGTVDLCNIKYIITHRGLNSKDFIIQITWEGITDPLLLLSGGDRESLEFARKQRKIYLYENKRYFPRAFLIPVSFKNEIENVLLNYELPRLFFSNMPDNAMQLLRNYKNVDIKWLPNAYKISFDSNSESFLFLSEMFYPGWKAKLDGKVIKILRPFNFFMGIFVPPGKHNVTFYFAPTYFYIFLVISFFTFAVLAFKMIQVIRCCHRRDTRCNF